MPFAILLVLGGATLLNQGMIAKIWLHDTFIVFDAFHRSALGQTPHVDFHTQIGQAYFWPFRIVASLGGSGLPAILDSYVLVAALLAVAIAILLPRRLTLGEIALTSLVILAMALTPRDEYGLPHNDYYSWLAPYNRWSWAIWMLIAQTLMIRPARARPVLDGIVLGLLMGSLLYVKVNFFAGAGLLALFALATGRATIVTAGFAAAAIIAMILGIELIWHNNLGYITDLGMAAGGRDLAGLFGRFVAIFRASLLQTVWILLVLWLARPDRPVSRWLAFWRQPLVPAMAVLAAGAVVGVQNFPEHEFGPQVVAALLAWQIARRQIARDEGTMPMIPIYAEHRRAISIAAFLVLTAVSGQASVRDAVAIFQHAVETRNGKSCRIPELAGTPGAGLMVPAANLAGIHEGDPSPPCSQFGLFEGGPDLDGRRDIFFVRKTERAVRLVRATARPGEAILALDFSNPYPFLLSAPSPRHALLWMHWGRNYGPQGHPTPAKLLGAVDMVVQTKLEFEQDHSAASAWAIYGPTVERGFHVVAENETVRLWRRNGRATINPRATRLPADAPRLSRADAPPR